MDAKALAGMGATVELKGKTFSLQVPTAGDLVIIDDDMLRLASAECPQSPVVTAAAIDESLVKGQDRAVMIQRATDTMLGGGASPTAKTMQLTHTSLAGLRKQFYRLTRRTHPELDEASIAALVGDADRAAVYDAVNAVLKAVDPKKV